MVNFLVHFCWGHVTSFTQPVWLTTEDTEIPEVLYLTSAVLVYIPHILLSGIPQLVSAPGQSAEMCVWEVLSACIVKVFSGKYTLDLWHLSTSRTVQGRPMRRLTRRSCGTLWSCPTRSSWRTWRWTTVESTPALHPAGRWRRVPQQFLKCMVGALRS